MTEKVTGKLIKNHLTVDIIRRDEKIDRSHRYG
jgi:hypothetical protein